MDGYGLCMLKVVGEGRGVGGGGEEMDGYGLCMLKVVGGAGHVTD